ncbi:uncharacterized protein LOC103572088 [Microplitis demolitor]|uniref:uncharacterized protein LOC103572088 n=1 Tax=Microplitis demolitor TaxID=69319 RepID=UPI0004CDBB20|nr:uncharacterized protein LOC103572088 [Microplitis demolitor]
MNNLIIKLITLVTFSSISYVYSHSIDKRSTSTEGVIVGPYTPVYYLEYPRDNYLKVRRLVHKFEASPSYNYYRLPENKSNGTLFLKVLVVLDWYDLVENRAEQDILNDVLRKWNKVDKYFGQLDNPKWKLVISGVVIPTKPNTWQSATEVEGTYCYLIPSFTKNLTNWFNDNADQFESFNYDLFVFMSHRELTSSKKIEDCMYDRHSSNNFACNTEHDSNHRSLGGVAVNNHVFTNSAAYTVASLLGVKTDQELGCESGCIMDSNQVRGDLTWSECSRRVFRSMFNDSAYTCLRQIIYEDENDYDD